MRLSDLKPLFHAWGLKDNEARVMTACLRNGNGLYVHEIVTQTRLKRSTVDLILQRLIELGFVIRLRTGQRYQYFPEKPETLLVKQQRQVDLFENLLPLLQAMQMDENQPDVRVYKGVESVSNHYRDVLSILKKLPPAQRVVNSIESGLDVLRIRPDLEQFFIRERVRHGIQINIICPEAAGEMEPYQTVREKFRECRYFRDTMKLFSMAMYLYHDRVSLISLRNPVQAVTIRHPVVRQSMETIWNLLWISLK
jgi:predicted transcriptional regulator